MDRYSQVVLTFIAVCLLALTVKFYFFNISDLVPFYGQINADPGLQRDFYTQVAPLAHVIANGIRIASDDIGGGIKVSGEVDCNLNQ